MPNLTRYPRGFVSIQGSRVSPIELKISEGDAEVTRLYRMFITRAVDVNSWEFKEHALKIANTMFGEFREWVRFQATANGNVYGLNWDFVLDTLHYISTGHRKMRVETWRELLLEYPATNDGVASNKRLQDLKAFETVLFAQRDSQGELIHTALSQWCARDGGFEDLMGTLFVFFGTEKIYPA